jgi:hypothetical protein
MSILKYINSKNGMANIQSIIIISTVLFLYECILFYFNLIPTIRNKLIKFINNLKYNIDNPALLFLKPILENNLLLDTLNVFYDREKEILIKNNNYTVITGLALLIILIYILILTHRKQKINNTVIAISFVVLVFIFIFQYLFYLFGKNYYYIDSISNDELKYFIISNL